MVAQAISTLADRMQGLTEDLAIIRNVLGISHLSRETAGGSGFMERLDNMEVDLAAKSNQGKLCDFWWDFSAAYLYLYNVRTTRELQCERCRNIGTYTVSARNSYCCQDIRSWG